MPKSDTANPFVNGFRLKKEVFAIYDRKAKEERRSIADTIRLTLEDHARDCMQHPELFEPRPEAETVGIP